jgi:CheY-like chemotaxis protein
VRAQGDRVLLIDDDPILAAMLVRLLERHGHQVRHVADGTAWRRPDVVAECDVLLTDIFMPDVEGLETIRRFRAARPELPIIAMSGGSPRMRGFDGLRAAQALGANAVFVKPLDTVRLVDVVAELAFPAHDQPAA